MFNKITKIFGVLILAFAFSAHAATFDYKKGAKIEGPLREALIKAVYDGNGISSEKKSDGVVRLTISPKLPADKPELNDVQYLTLYWEAAVANPNDIGLAKAGELLARKHEQFFKTEPPDSVQQQLLMTTIGLQMKLPPVTFKSYPGFYAWLKNSDIHRQSELYGHEWKLNRYGVPQLLLPGGKISWMQLEQEGIADNSGHLARGWAYTKDGFARVEEVAPLDPLSPDEHGGGGPSTEPFDDKFPDEPGSLDDLDEFVDGTPAPVIPPGEERKYHKSIWDGTGGWGDDYCANIYNSSGRVAWGCKLVPLEPNTVRR
ncbi:MAG: hypothetical protein Q8K75_03050 [Chlamydiales bacterium]|nr:hypothetical protein [Chlamydiales bacterium]